MYLCIYVSMYLYLRTHIHTYVRTYIPTYIPTYLHTYIPTYLHTYLHTYIPTYLHTNIPTYQHTNIPTYQHTNIPPPQATGGGLEEPDDTVHPYPFCGGGVAGHISLSLSQAPCRKFWAKAYRAVTASPCGSAADTLPCRPRGGMEAMAAVERGSEEGVEMPKMGFLQQTCGFNMC